jgi:hypothetical protein
MFISGVGKWQRQRLSIGTERICSRTILEGIKIENIKVDHFLK